MSIPQSNFFCYHNLFFAVGSEETVLPFGYEGTGEGYVDDDSYEEAEEEYEFVGKIDIDDSEAYAILHSDDLDIGCSVYCAVENEEISQAWVEGSDDSGIGEYLEIRRKLDVSDKSYGIDYTQICIGNGYMKNDDTWKNNNRVKTLEFYYNGKYICDLDLEDTISPQYFDISEYNLHADSGEEVVFKYVIKDVYKGDKYDDTTITGITVDFYTPNH